MRKKAGGLSQGGTSDPNDILLLEKGSHRKWQNLSSKAFEAFAARLSLLATESAKL